MSGKQTHPRKRAGREMSEPVCRNCRKLQTEIVRLRHIQQTFQAVFTLLRQTFADEKTDTGST